MGQIQKKGILHFLRRWEDNRAIIQRAVPALGGAAVPNSHDAYPPTQLQRGIWEPPD